MKKLFLLMFILSLPISIYAQPENIKSKKAIQFAINGLELNSLNGGFGWKKWLKNDLAICNLIVLEYTYDEKKPVQLAHGYENKNWGIELGLVLEKHLNPGSRLSPYWGGQLSIGFEKELNKIVPTRERSYLFEDYYTNTEYEQTMFRIHPAIVVGAEYFFGENISLAGQYNFGGVFQFGEEKTTNYLNNKAQDLKKAELGIWSSVLMVSVYF